MQFYRDYYLKHGVRTFNQLKSPPLDSISSIYLPVNSIYHYLDRAEDGVSEDDPVFTHSAIGAITEQIYRYNLNGGIPVGNPVLLTKPIDQLERSYYQNNRKFRRLSASRALVKNNRNLVIYNYGSLDKLYRYQTTPKEKMYRWYNFIHTVINAIKDAMDIQDRQHFIRVEVPLSIPPISLLTQAEKDRFALRVTDYFNNDSSCFVLELWLWLAGEVSAFSRLSANELHRVNLIWQVGGLWTVINIGTLHSWAVDSVDVKGKPIRAITNLHDLQRKFLLFLMQLNQTLSVNALDETTPEEGSDGTDEEPKEKLNFDSIGVKPILHEDDSALINNGDEVLSTDEAPDKNQLAALDELENIYQLQQEIKEAQSTDQVEAYQPITDSDELMTHQIQKDADQAARLSKLTAGEHKRIISLSNRYTQIRNPYNEKESLAEMSVIDPKLLTMPDEVKLADDIIGVRDKSMLSSSLNVLDNQYIQKVLPKDVVKMVLNLQQAGIIVDDYKVTKKEDILDNYETHTIRLIPVVGKPSTISFKIPVVGEDGLFTAGGVRYRMRKQRGDLPIRKVAPDKVAITSYYSKNFITRTTRRKFNSDEYVLNQLNRLMLEKKVIKSVRLGNVFNPDIGSDEKPLPRYYSTIGTRFSYIELSDYELSFDYLHRKNFFGEHSDVYGDGFIIIGRPKTQGEPYWYLDRKGLLWSGGKGFEKKEYVNLISVLGITPADVPSDLAEIKVRGKELPIGVVMAYHVGFRKLLATMGVTPNIVPRNSRSNIPAMALSIAFEDEIWYFTGINRMQRMILNGFNRFEKEIKRYSVYQFDTKEVYDAVFDAAKFGARYLREVDLMFKLWMDHITKEILETMHEPTDLFNLLFSAVNKLSYNEHPAPMDIAYQRDKGYERMAGMMYGELITAIRQYKSRGASANASIEVNPYSVWYAIMQDPTVGTAEESNPIHSLKEKEIVVFGGKGGRSARSMNEEARKYHKNAMGVVGEANVDNGDVAITTYTSADPNYANVRGTTKRVDNPKKRSARMISTSMLLSPFADRDDQLVRLSSNT